MPAVVQSVISTNRHSCHTPYVLSDHGKIVNAAKNKRLLKPRQLKHTNEPNKKAN